jgi:lysophospholipase L1-like esterase
MKRSRSARASVGGGVAVLFVPAAACGAPQSRGGVDGQPTAGAVVSRAGVSGEGGTQRGTTDAAQPCASPDATLLDAGANSGPAVHFVGRMDTVTLDQPRFEWEGSAIEASFTGTQVAITLAGDPSAPNYFAVFIDGAAQPTLLVNGAAPTSYPLAAGLSAGPHHVLVFRRAESIQNITRFVKFDFGPGGALLAPPAPPTRRIELIGDSITAGYGVECANATTAFTAATENEYIAYGSIAARDLGAEAHVIAWSGEGVYRNYAADPDAGTHMPEYWLRTLPTEPTSAWDFARWVPDAVVVNLGTNDFSGTPPADIDEKYESHYRAFVQKIHGTYPNAKVFCALGPMLTEPRLSEARTAINNVIASLHATGFAGISLVEFSPQDCGPAGGGCGCDFHPSASTHRQMAKVLEGAIRAALAW